MCGRTDKQGPMFLLINVEAEFPADHPLRAIKRRDGTEPERDESDPGNPTVNFHGEQRTNATHVSATDPEARLLRKGKGKEALL